MKRIINTSAGPRGLRNGAVELKLPVGGFAMVEDEAWEILNKSKIVRSFVDRRLISVSEKPLGHEVPLKKGTTEKEMPERYKPTEETAAFGSAAPVETKVETIQVKAKETTGKGKRVTAKKVEK